METGDRIARNAKIAKKSKLKGKNSIFERTAGTTPHLTDCKFLRPFRMVYLTQTLSSSPFSIRF